MTREKAIEKLEQTVGAYLLSGNADNTYCKEWREILEALEQEPNRDMEEIAEIMKCDADAETKCNMISNILTAKPHYFAEQEPSEDTVSREEAIKAQCEACDICGNTRYTKCQYFTQGCNEVKCLRELPSVMPKPIECEDAVSIDVIIEWLKSKDIIKMSNQEINARKELQALLSVQPKAKKGHWNKSCRCSECGYGIVETEKLSGKYKFCPNCGAKMVEP